MTTYAKDITLPNGFTVKGWLTHEGINVAKWWRILATNKHDGKSYLLHYTCIPEFNVSCMVSDMAIDGVKDGMTFYPPDRWEFSFEPSSSPWEEMY